MSHDTEYMVERIKKELLGRTIVGVLISDDPDVDDQEQSFGFLLDNDLQVWVDRDAEGNGPGWLQME